MRPRSNISFYSVEAEDQRGYVTCLMRDSKSVVTVDLIQIARLHSWGFFLNAYGERKTPYYIHCVESGKQRTWQSVCQLCAPQFSMRQSPSSPWRVTTKANVLHSPQLSLWLKPQALVRWRWGDEEVQIQELQKNSILATLPLSPWGPTSGGQSQCISFPRLVDCGAPWGCGDIVAAGGWGQSTLRTVPYSLLF